MTNLDEAVASGARLERACESIGLSVRSVQRWRTSELAQDGRKGPRHSPANKLSEVEQKRLLSLLNSEENRDLSPKQIVPRLADAGTYAASESTLYRLLRAEEQLAHRGSAKPPVRRKRPEHLALGPNRVWSWDISVPQKAA